MTMILKAMGIVLALACVVSMGFWTTDTSVSPVSDELPEGYWIDGYGWSSDSNDMMYDEHVTIRHSLCRLELGQSYITGTIGERTRIKFCGYSSSGEIYLTINNEDYKLEELESTIPNSSLYISYKNLEPEKGYIRISWIANLQKNESITLSSGENVVFPDFDKNMKPILKVE